MSVSTEILARKYTNPVAGTPINVDYPLFAEAHCVALYGIAGNVAILDTDFTLTLNTVDYSDFTLTPTASLRTKIDAMIVADPTESDQIVVRRDMPMLTDMSPTLARLREQIALEFDRTALRLQQVQEIAGRSLQLAETDVSGDSNVLPAMSANLGIKRNATNDGWVATTGDPDEQTTDAAASAAAALASQVAAASSEANAATSETNAGNSETAAASSETNAAASAVLAQNAANSGLYKQIIDKNADYTTVVADQGALFQVDTSGGDVTITLELLATLGEDFRNGVAKMTADANTVIVQRTGGNTINGGASIVLDSQYAVYNFIGDMDDGEWLASDASIASIPDATETVKGIVELATQTETDAGADTGRVITPATLAGYSGLGAKQNLIINGAMGIVQRGTSFVSPSHQDYTLDRWFYAKAGTSADVTITQDTDVPTEEYDFSMKVDVTAADASMDAGDLIYIGHRIEAFNTASLALGDAAASDIAIKVWVKSPKSGTHYCSTLNSALDRSYPGSFNITSADTWEEVTVTLTGDTSGTWVRGTNGVGLLLTMTLMAGSTYQGTADAWNAGTYVAGSGQQNLMDNVANNFSMTGARLVKGDMAPASFVSAGGSYGAELALCQRYAWQQDGFAWLAVGQCESATFASLLVHFPEVFRATPNLVFTAASDFLVRSSVGGNVSCTAMTLTEVVNKIGRLNATTAGSLSAGDATLCCVNINSALFDAEL